MSLNRMVWFNGNIVPESEAKLSIYDSALMYGDMVFEMTRSFNGIQFKLEEHIERLLRSVKYTRIPLAMTKTELIDACLAIQEANQFKPDDEHRLMINVTRGLLSIYEQTASYPGPNVIISDFPLRWTTAGMGKLFDDGINAVTPSQRAIPAHLLEPKVKSRSRMHYLMANIEVSQYKGDNNWALLLDPDGFVTEGTGANFFIVKDEIVTTPEPRNVLRGITRQTMFKFGQLQEENVEPYDVYNADEAFFTGTPFCMLPVTSYNGEPIGDGRVGSMFNKILKQWNKLVGLDIKAQIQNWDKGAKEGATPYKF